MKSMLKFVAVLSLVLFVSACDKNKNGGGAGGGLGEKNAGVGADGKCSDKMIADLEEFAREFQDAGLNNDLPKAKSLCRNITAKYGNTSCKAANGGTFDGSELERECNKLP